VGIHVEAAINHSKIAVASHAANHPMTTHYQQSIEECNPDTMPDSDWLLTSPCCTNHSPAKGQKQYHSFDLFGEIVFDPLAEKSRNTMDDVVRFAAAKKRAGKPYTFIVVENVVDVIRWRKYSSWLTSLTALGYNHQTLYWNTQFFGVPQSRDRVYIVLWLRDVPAPNLEHRPATFCPSCEREIWAVQSWKGQKWGRYREQYVYRCPQCNHEVTPAFTPSHVVLNLDRPGRTVGERVLKPRTVKNIHEGIERLGGQPFLLGYYNHPLFRRLDEPVGTITTMDRWALVIPARRFEDTTLRMLSVQEVKACMGFPTNYCILGSAKEQIWMLGNAVCPAIMTDILKRCLFVLMKGAV
jgi:DNA (cytosine-5)-methyltransferase 1